MKVGRFLRASRPGTNDMELFGRMKNLTRKLQTTLEIMQMLKDSLI